MKRAAHSLIMGLVLLALCAGFAAVALFHASKMEKTLPDGVALWAGGSFALSFSDIREVTDAKTVQYGFATGARDAALVNEKNQYAFAAIVAANSRYGAILNPDYLTGGWFSENAVQTAERYAVLPDSVMMQLFGSYVIPPDAKITISGEEYFVCGVYKPTTGVIAQMSSDGTPVVYLSRPVGKSDESYISELLLAGESNAELLTRSVAVQLDTPLYGYTQDWRNNTALAWQLCYLFFALCCALPVVWVMGWGIRRLVALYASQNVLSKAGAFNLAGGFAAIGLGLLAVWLLASHLSIPQAYLPPDNILDISYYVDYVKSYYQTQIASGVVNPLARQVEIRLIVIGLCGVAWVTLFYTGLYRLRAFARSVLQAYRQG